MEGGRMPYKWPSDTDFALRELDFLDRACPTCGRMMHICDHRYRRIHTLEGPVQLVCKLNHCPDPDCPGHAQTKSPEQEAMIAPPNWAIGWDVFCWIGHRRCAAPHVDSPHPIRASRRLRDQALGRCHRQVHSALPGDAHQHVSKIPKPCVANTNRSMRSCCRLTGCNPRRDTRLSMS